MRINRTELRLWFNALPTPITGVALALGSLLNAWLAQQVAPPVWLGRLIWFSIAVAVGAILLKYLLNPRQLYRDLNCPLLGSVLPTATMATMLLSAAMLPHRPQLAPLLWQSAVALHLGLFVLFVWLQLRQFALDRMLPSWFVPPVGIGVAAVTAPVMGQQVAGQWLIGLALVCYALLLPMMLYRLGRGAKLQNHHLPSFAIMAAPPNLCLAGLLAVYPDAPLLLVVGLLGLGLLMTTLVYLKLVGLLRLPFFAGFAALTFPLVIGAIAHHNAALVLARYAPAQAELVNGIAAVELWVATAVVGYIALRYLTLLTRTQRLLRS